MEAGFIGICAAVRLSTSCWRCSSFREFGDIVVVVVVVAVAVVAVAVVVVVVVVVRILIGGNSSSNSKW